MSLRKEIIRDLQVMENDLCNPTFTWQGNSYIFIPSITMFNRTLDTGGFQLIRLLTATVRKFNLDCDDNFEAIFVNGMPQPQQTFTYNLDGTNYRVESIKGDPTDSYFRMIAHSTSKGI